MKITCLNIKGLEKEHNFYDISYFNNNFEVYAIAKFKNKLKYLVKIYSGIFWFNSNLFDITDNAISKEWVEMYFKYFHNIRNKKYNYSLPINYYYGPKEFIENQDFLFDIYENPACAFEYFCKYINKNWSDGNE